MLSPQTAIKRSSSLGQILKVATQRLNDAHVDAPRLVAESLLAHTLDLDRTQILARVNEPANAVISVDQISNYESLIRRCELGEPFAYVIGRREFYGLDLLVDPRVLIPRPETELLVETAIKAAESLSNCAIVDVGCGSGAIAIALALHLPQARLSATDISPDAITVASQNARCHDVDGRIEFIVGDLLAPIGVAVDLIVANLPYVSRDEWVTLTRSIRTFEPSIALKGGIDGLVLVARLLRDAPRVLRPGGMILLEIGATQGDAALQLARDLFPMADAEIKKDYSALDRMLVVRNKFMRPK